MTHRTSSDSLVITNAIIATLGRPARILNDHNVIVKGNKISAILPKALYKPHPTDTIIDAKGKVLLPGFINTHMHFYSTFARGLTKAQPSKNFQEVLKHLWWRLDRKLSLDDVYMSALIACIDGIKHGTTTYIDHHASPFAVSGSLKKIADAVQQAGVRASLCYELSDRDGEAIAAKGIEENIRFLEESSRYGEQLKALFGMHASFTISDETMTRAVAEAKRLGAGFHIHTAEDLSDQEHAQTNFSQRVVERLDRLGILGDKTICAHCVHINDAEIEILKQTNTVVVHNPQSNMNNAVGVARILTMMEKGITVGLGTDAMTTNMLEELRAAIWVRHLSENNPNAGFVECAQTLVENNARIVNRHWSEKMGEIKEGYLADLILVDYQPPTPLNEGNFLGHLVFGISQSTVDTTIANGQILMRDKQLLTIDEEAVAFEARKLSERLWTRF